MNAQPLFPAAFMSILALAGLLQGCASPRTDVNPRMDKIEASLGEKAAQPAAGRPISPPPAVEARLLAPTRDDLARLAPSSAAGRFDVSVHDAPAREFFMGLVQGTPYNMVVHPDVQGSIDLDLKGVTVDEVLHLVRESYGYEFERDGLNYIVLPPRLQTRLFQINYLNVNRGGQSSTQVNSGQVSQDSNNNNTGTTQNDTTSRSDTNSLYGSQLYTQSQSDYWRELTASLCTLIGLPLRGEPMPQAGSMRTVNTPLGCHGAPLEAVPVNLEEGANPALTRPFDQRSIVVSPQSGLVVARAMPYELREIERYLHQSESNVERQVLLEAKLIEVVLNDGFQSGINWAALNTWNDGDSSVLAGQTGGGTLLNNGQSEIAGNTGILNPDARQFIEGTAASAFGGMFTLTLATQDFTAFIELLKSQGDVQVLSSPRISTLNNQKAVIKVGSDAYYITGLQEGEYTYNQVTGVGTTSVPYPEFTSLFSGISLDVTPQINKDEVVLHIHPMVREVSEQIKQYTISNQSNSLPLAVAKVREADAIVRAKNGQVIVIGGLMEDRGDLMNASVPGVGDLPGIGELFKHRKNASSKTELVILLRPVVVNNDRDWQQDIDATRMRIQQLRMLQKPLQPPPEAE